MTLIARAAIASPLVLFTAVPALGQEETARTEHYDLSIQTVLSGVEHPWALAFVSEDRFLVTERNSGTLSLASLDGSHLHPLWQAEDLFRYEGETGRSQAGMFDVKLHPGFEDNGWVYVSYSRQTERGAAVVIVRGTLEAGENGEMALSEIEDIFVMKEDDQDSSGLHFGGRMAFDPADASLFLSIGERRNIERAQDATDQAGSVLRMTDQGEPHPDNVPFEVEDPEDGEPDAYLFSIGNRNIQALTVHPTTNELWAADHGPEGGDEIQLIEAGNNYGWPFITGGEDYSGAPIGVGLAMEGMISPVHVFEETVAPSGLTFVPEGTSFAEWTGDLLVGGLVTEGLVRITLQDGQVANEEVIEIGQRVRDVQIGPDGDIWLVTDHADGTVLRVTPQG
ncbi:PQQ-dependent sugar dehydrogenase [Pelagibacterium limicola]|uniref:PQQ-dependent sugar dehydrogenase n=1 Tax=Pelagibacterium limicola TaxID=2791022 RepID=UPI0018AFB6AE|nr:PQQ-dependent sugar dehydrogenase [Pelagibacterium limicola]